MKFIAQNEKDLEHYYVNFETLKEARHWVINHCDLSKNWEVKPFNIITDDSAYEKTIGSMDMYSVLDIPF
jgi:hypothetical protein